MKKTENIIRKEYEAKGYTVLRNGWPDFLVMKEGKAFGVEVKSYGESGGCALGEGQAEMHAALLEIGLPVIIRWVKGTTEYLRESVAVREARLLENAYLGKNKKHGNGKRGKK